MTTQTIQILDGPSREELFDALRLFNEFRELEFTLPDRFLGHNISAKSKVKIVSIGAEDGSGNCWIIEVRLESGNVHRGFYNTKDRKGFLESEVLY